MRVFFFLLNAFFWILLFLVPASVTGFSASLIYHYAPNYLFVSVAIAVLGMILGFQLAEYVRRKYGLESFFAKLLFTSELE